MSTALVFASSAAGEDVTLKLKDGDLAVTGELMASDTRSYVIKSQKYGVMALETAKFECSGRLCPRPAIPTIGIHGSNTIGAQLMPNTIERFAESENYSAEKVVGNDAEEVLYKLTTNDGKDVAAIDLRSHGTGTAPPSLAQGKAQIGEMSRPMNAAEIKAITDAGLKIKTHVYALDGLLVFVSPQNPVKALSLEQIAKVFAGEIKDWAQVGGRPGKINLYARDNKSGTFDTFDALVLKPQKLKISAEAKRFESTTDLSDETARDPNGIGFG